jgi:hypothetical protein
MERLEVMWILIRNTHVRRLKFNFLKTGGFREAQVHRLETITLPVDVFSSLLWQRWQVCQTYSLAELLKQIVGTQVAALCGTIDVVAMPSNVRIAPIVDVM